MAEAIGCIVTEFRRQGLAGHHANRPSTYIGVSTRLRFYNEINQAISLHRNNTFDGIYFNGVDQLCIEQPV
jgi:hypothetical protein